MLTERQESTKERQLHGAKILMISRFNPESIGGIPSTINTLQKFWKDHVQDISVVGPKNQRNINLHDDWDLAIFHHPPAFGIKKFLELPEKLKLKSNII